MRQLTTFLLIALAVLVLFLFTGRFILELLQISDPALTLAGGVILFLIALRMVFPTPESSMQEGVDGLLKDKTRPSRKPPLSKETVARVVELTLGPPPGEITGWARARPETEGWAGTKGWPSPAWLPASPPASTTPLSAARAMRRTSVK